MRVNMAKGPVGGSLETRRRKLFRSGYATTDQIVSDERKERGYQNEARRPKFSTKSPDIAELIPIDQTLTLRGEEVIPNRIFTAQGGRLMVGFTRKDGSKGRQTVVSFARETGLFNDD